ncbi:sulfurtransferase [Dyella tabacisoli]|uniref:Sulfurtransferase n=1 Tax=Dyella tabacisoli TaxID=2282381 RepID=A0A369UHF1_9GAMM|nr:sulfurtransferase [Dyella tabacisoli]RDD79907.1 sulfurtransferase [Dyella tabacisoli]
MSLHTTLIDAAALAVLPPGQVLIVDCRVDMADPGRGERDYREGHIPGAVFASLDHELSDLSRQALGLGRHPLPLESAFSALLSSWGWHPGLQVVCYDTQHGALAAARLWWMLRLVGAPEVAVLDGGYAAWLAAGLPVETAIPVRQPTHVERHYDLSQVVLDHETLRNASDQLVLDARAAPRYRGDIEPLDRVAGHVPGASNRPFSDNLDAQGRFKPAEVLRREFLAVLGAAKPAQVVHMCGSGVTACHNLLAMEYAGLNGARLYAPSWSGWISDPSRPIERDDTSH